MCGSGAFPDVTSLGDRRKPRPGDLASPSVFSLTPGDPLTGAYKCWKAALSHLPPREQEHGGGWGSLGHLFRFDWWVLAGERGTSVVWQCQALHATAALLGPIVPSAKNSNHFQNPSVGAVSLRPHRSHLTPPPHFPILRVLPRCIAVRPGSSKRSVCECARFSGKVQSAHREGSEVPQKNVRIRSTKTRRRIGEQSHTERENKPPALIKHWP